jgi:hypothetical protein
MRNLLLTLTLFLACAVPALAADISLTWDANAEADLAGYNLYRSPMSCTNPTGFIKVQSFGPVVSGADQLTVDGVYCYALTARDTANNESVQSNRVEVTLNQNPPLAPRNLRRSVAP